MDDDEDIGKLLERASREKLQPTNKIPILAPESMDTTTGPARIDHDAVSPEPLTVTPLKPFTRIAPSEAKAPRVPKGKVDASFVLVLRKYEAAIPRLFTQLRKSLLIQRPIIALLFSESFFQ